MISSGLRKRRKHCGIAALYCLVVVVGGAIAMEERRGIVVYKGGSAGNYPSTAEIPGG